tara:strand:+ start:961 stop:1188 length:228 start_codon:yes stop_codon:yes gene_type:complete
MKDLDKLRNKISNIWNHTELEMDDLSRIGLKKELSAISNIVNDLMNDLDKISTCHICSKDICVSCLDDMAKSLNV